MLPLAWQGKLPEGPTGSEELGSSLVQNPQALPGGPAGWLQLPGAV